jgi:hypothetical protein
MKKSAQIYSDDKNAPVLTLQIFGDVEKFVTITPRTVSLRGFVGDAIKKSVTIVPEEKYNFEITKVRARNGEYINYQLEKIKDTARTEYSLTIENMRTEAGRYSDVIVMETDSKIRSQVQVRVYGNLRPRPAEE